MVSWFLWDPAPPFVADHYGVRVVGLVDNRHYPSLCLLTKSLFDSISFFFFVVSLYQSWYDSEPVLLGKQSNFFYVRQLLFHRVHPLLRNYLHVT